MKRGLLFFIFLASAVVANTQPYPLLGSPNGNTISVVNALRGFQLPRGVDTTLNGRNDSVGMLFYKTDKTVWLRVPSGGTANKWVRFGGSLDSVYATQAWALSQFPQLTIQYNNPSWLNTLHTDKLFNSSATFPQTLVADGSGGFVPYTLPALYTSDTATMLIPYKHWLQNYLKGTDTLGLSFRINQRVPTTRTITTTAPLQGGGDLSVNRTLSIDTANANRTGSLSRHDWTVFNNKAGLSSFNTFTTRNRFTSLSFNKDSVPIFTGRQWGLLLDTTDNLLKRQQLFALPTLTSGSVLFSDGTTIAQDNANFFWDNINKKLWLKRPTSSSTLNLLEVTNGNIFVGTALTGVTISNNYGSNFGELKFASAANPDVGVLYATLNAATNRPVGLGLLTERPALNTHIGTILSSAGGGVNYYSSSNGANHSHRWFHNQVEQMRLWHTGNLVLGTPGADAGFRLDVNGTARIVGKITQPTTANSPKGAATLVNGTVTISNTLATTGCFITVNYRTGTALSGSSSILVVSSLTNATSFTVTAYNAGAVTTNTSDNNIIEYTISN